MKEMTTYTLWHGYLPLINYYGAFTYDERGAYRVANDTMTSGAVPIHFSCKDKAERLAKIYAIDGEDLEIQTNTVEIK